MTQGASRIYSPKATDCTVMLRYNAVVGRHLLTLPHKRGALWDPVDLFDIVIPGQRYLVPTPRLGVELVLCNHSFRNIQSPYSHGLKGHCIEFKYYADGIHSGLTPPS